MARKGRGAFLMACASAFAEGEELEGGAEVRRERRVSADVLTGREGIGELEFLRVEHLTGDREEARVVGLLDAILAVADDGVADAGQVAADLVGAPRLNADGQEGGIGRGTQTFEVGDGALAIERLGEGAHLAFEAARDNGGIVLDHAMRAEHGDGGLEGLGVLREEEHAAGLAVQTMDGGNGGIALLLAEQLFGGVAALSEDPRGLVDGQVVTVLPEHTDVGGAIALLALLGAGAGLDHEGHLVAGLERVTRNPDQLAVDPDDAGVDHRLGGALGGLQAARQEVLQADALLVARDDGDFGLGGRRVGAHGVLTES